MKCEINPAIVDFRSQHIRFDLLIDGRLQSYVPDVLALMHDGSITVIEVDKGRSKQPEPQYRAKLDIVRDICADLEWRFEIWSERTLAPTRRVRDNIAQIQMQRFISIDSVQILVVSRALRENGGRLAVGQIRTLLGCRLGAGDLVRGLMCRGLLELPLDKRIDHKTIATLFTRCVSPSFEHAM
ncbi:TnsA endonuclease N-terminal domain-containing protein [Sphingomonas xinjiangensis]|uniref:TnsA endonuclease N-terminal domain-containing protein n=1 Tax=Sphingomonas xinjiangensis TaxID=643568 RepID=A0A840YR36_9SPHN|nr:TnsA endonuclease N-terminal domain-containing protein [Sphingomonas xinjiangensis]MBB5711871.1 hypothetical protein [Sphingomonas xinjiangensis]